MAGCFYACSDDPAANALAETIVAIAGILQMVALIFAGYYTQEKIEEHWELLQQPRPEDQDIIKLEEESAQEAKNYERAARWERLESSQRALLVLGLAAVEVACLLLASPLPTLKEFDMTSTISDDLGGNAWSVVEPLGWLAITTAVFDSLLLTGFYLLTRRTMGKYTGVNADESGGSAAPLQPDNTSNDTGAGVEKKSA